MAAVTFALFLVGQRHGRGLGQLVGWVGALVIIITDEKFPQFPFQFIKSGEQTDSDQCLSSLVPTVTERPSVHAEVRRARTTRYVL